MTYHGVWPSPDLPSVLSRRLTVLGPLTASNHVLWPLTVSDRPLTSPLVLWPHLTSPLVLWPHLTPLAVGGHQQRPQWGVRDEVAQVTLVGATVVTVTDQAHQSRADDALLQLPNLPDGQGGLRQLQLRWRERRQLWEDALLRRRALHARRWVEWAA